MRQSCRVFQDAVAFPIDRNDPDKEVVSEPAAEPSWSPAFQSWVWPERDRRVIISNRFFSDSYSTHPPNERIASAAACCSLASLIFIPNHPSGTLISSTGSSSVRRLNCSQRRRGFGVVGEIGRHTRNP